MAQKPKKKVVRVSSEEAVTKATKNSTFTPTEEAKKGATTRRIIALILWALAIGGEAYAIFGVLLKEPVNMVLLIILLVVIAILSIVGSVLWKKANRLDPASEKQKVKFFVQNQLGLIIAIIAFLPLIVLIFMNKDMDGQQKGIAGGIAIVLLVIAGWVGLELNPASVEQYNAETQQVIDITGKNEVFWTKSGKVYHLCESASAVNLESKDNTIYRGTVADAVAAGKERLTLQVNQEIKQCGFDLPADSDNNEEDEVSSDPDGQDAS